jgi:hypothetical protein
MVLVLALKSQWKNCQFFYSLGQLALILNAVALVSFQSWVFPWLQEKKMSEISQSTNLGTWPPISY